MKTDLELMKKSCDEKDDKIGMLEKKCVTLELEIERLKKDLFLAQEDQQRSERRLKDLQARSEIARVEVKPTYETSFEVRRSRKPADNVSIQGRGRKTSTLAMDIGKAPSSQPGSPRLEHEPLNRKMSAPVTQSSPRSAFIRPEKDLSATFEEPVIEVQAKPVEDEPSTPDEVFSKDAPLIVRSYGENEIANGMTSFVLTRTHSRVNESRTESRTESTTDRRSTTNHVRKFNEEVEVNQRTMTSVTSVSEDLAYAEGKITTPRGYGSRGGWDRNSNYYL